MTTTKLITLALATAGTLFLNGCKNEPSEACVQLEKADTQLKANLEMYEATWDVIINEGKLEEINENNFDAGITLVASPENVVGIDAFKAYYSNFVTGFSEVSFTIVDIFGQGDKIVKHWNFKGVHSGEFFGIPATGNKVDVSGVTLVQMKDGKIAREQDFMDNLEFYQQLGLIPRE